MYWTMRLRCLIALSLGTALAVVAYHWPASPRSTVPCEQGCWHLAFSPDGATLAVLDREPGLNPHAQILLWDAATGTLRHRVDCSKTTYPRRVVFAPDGQTCGLLDVGLVTKWDVATARLLASYDHADWPHDPDHHGCEILFSPEGRWLLHNVHVGRVYDVETGDVVHDYGKRLPDRNLGTHGGCFAARVNGEVWTFDALTGAAIASYPILTAAKTAPMSRTLYAFSRDGLHGAYFTDANQWAVRNAATGAELLWASDAEIFAGYGFVFSPDNRYLAVAASEAHSGMISAVRARLAGRSCHTRIIDTTTGNEVGSRMLSGGIGFQACFAPDSKTVALVDYNGQVALWDWPPASRWPLAVGFGVLGVGLPFAVGPLVRRARSGCTPMRNSIKTLYPQR